MYLLIILPWSTKNFGVTWCTLIRDWLTIDNLRKISSFQKLFSFPCVWMADSFRNPRECLGAAQFFTVAMSEHYHMLPFLCISFKYPLEALLPMNPCSHVTPLLRQCIHCQQPRPLHLLLLWQGIAIQLLEISALLDIILSYDHMVFFSIR